MVGIHHAIAVAVFYCTVSIIATYQQACIEAIYITLNIAV